MQLEIDGLIAAERKLAERARRVLGRHAVKVNTCARDRPPTLISANLPPIEGVVQITSFLDFLDNRTRRADAASDQNHAAT